VLRMFDPDLARRVAHHFDLATTFSSAALVASRFAAPATNSTRLCNLEFQDLQLDVHSLNISSREEAAKVYEQNRGRVLAAVDSEGRLRFDVDHDSLVPGSIIVLK